MKSIAVLAALIFLGGCAKSSAPDIATVDIGRITSNWPKFINYNNQINADAAAIDRSPAPQGKKDAERAVLQRRYSDMQDEVTGDVRAAAQQVAADRHFRLVVTREYVGYGGVDITPDVEKILKITEPKSKS